MSPTIPAAISAVEAPVIPAMVSITPMSRRTPMAPRPRPTVIAPSPAPAYPDVTRCGTSRCDLNYGRRHRRLDNDRSRRNHHRSRGGYDRHGKRDAEADADMNASVYSSDSQGCQGQDCDCLFHILCWFDARATGSMVINRPGFCNRLRRPIALTLSMHGASPVAYSCRSQMRGLVVWFSGFRTDSKKYSNCES